MPRPPMVTVIGRKHSGKTTFVVQLTAELRRRGHRVMTIKHGSHTFNIDPASTDTYRHYHEGEAERVAMVAPDKFALVARWSEEATAESIAEQYMADAGVVVCEGFKASALPRIEIHRRAVHESPLFDRDAAAAPLYLAVVTDDPALDLPPSVPRIALDAANCVHEAASLVEREVMGLR